MNKSVTQIIRVIGLCALLFCVSGLSQSIEARPLSNPEIRRAISSGQIVPYSVAMTRARAYTKGGDVLRAKLVSARGRLIYRLRMLLPNGRVMIVIVDAHSGRVIGGR